MTTRFIGHLLTGTHAARPAASAVPEGTLYSCTDHDLVYQSDLATWATWLDAGAATISAGSNSTRVREVSTAGASTTLWSPFDHAHDGIGTITASGSNTMQRGTFNLRTGNNISFGLTDGDGDGEFDTLTIHGAAAGGGGGGSLTVADEGTPLATAATTLDFVGAGVTASGTGATKTITIAGGGSSVTTFPLDNPPSSPDADDDEFDGGSLSGAWTDPITSASGQGNTIVVQNGRLYLESDTAGSSSTGKHVFGIRKASPSGSFTVAAKLAIGAPGSDLRPGLHVGVTGGKGHVLGPFPQDLVVGYMASSTISDTADWSSHDGANQAFTGYGWMVPTWVRFRWDSATSTLYMDVSQNGAAWRQMHSRASLTQPDRMGIVLYSNGGTVAADALIVCDWFRVIDGSATFTSY